MGRPGEIVVDSTNNRLAIHDGTTPGGFPTVTAADLKTLQNVTLLGLGTTADAQNPFAAKLNKALWTALTAAEGGTGDLRYTLKSRLPATPCRCCSNPASRAAPRSA